MRLEVVARFILKFPISIFFISCLLAVVSVYFVVQIKLDSSLKALLPQDHPVLKVLDEANEIFDHKDMVIILIRSRSAFEGEEFVRVSAEALKKQKEFKKVYYQLPRGFFYKNILLYLDQEDLTTIYNRLENKIEFEKRKGRMGLLIDEISGKDPGFFYKDILEKYKKKINFDFSGYKTNFFYKRKEKTVDQEESHIFLMMVKPQKSAINISYASAVMKTLSQVMESYQKKYPEIQSVEYTGRYQKKPESLQALVKNFKKVTLISFLAILLVLFAFFRTIRPIILLFIGLVYGILLTLGITQIFIGSLNLISSFLIAILFGLGIDFGIHIILRYKEERDAGKSVDEAFILMYTETCLASIFAAFTTSISFLGLLYSDFIGLHDFAWIACLGVLCILFSYMTLLPSLMLIVTHHFNIRIIFSTKKFSLPEKLWKRPKVLALISTAISIFSIVAASGLTFNYDFSRLLGDKKLPSYALNREVKQLFGQGIDVPSLIIAENREEEKKILRYMEARKDGTFEKKMINLVLGLSSFVPENQNKKLISIRKIKRLIDSNKKYFDKMNVPHQEENFDFKSQLTPKRITERELPDYIKDTFQAKNSNETRRMLLAYSEIKGEDGLAVMQFADYVNRLKIDSKPIKVAADRLIFAEILTLIRDKGRGILVFSFLAIFLMVCISMKSIYRGALTVLPVIIGVIWMIGLQSALGIQNDFVNIITYLIVLGTSIDASIHLYSRFMESDDLFLSIRETGNAISVSSLTTFVAFGALLFAKNESITGLGILAMIGIGTGYLSCMLILPTILQFLIKHQKLIK